MWYLHKSRCCASPSTQHPPTRHTFRLGDVFCWSRVCSCLPGAASVVVTMRAGLVWLPVGEVAVLSLPLFTFRLSGGGVRLRWDLEALPEVFSARRLFAGTL